MEDLKQICTGIVLCCALLFVPIAVHAASVSPFSAFGGTISTILYCANGATYIILSSQPLKPLIYQAGLSKSYQKGPPWRIGQKILGLSFGPAVCSYGAANLTGTRILFHGSSL